MLALRDITDLAAALGRLSDPIARRRVRHVVTENERVEHAVHTLREGKTADLAPLLDASHASMRDDLEITVPTVDLAVETARRWCALGARMTGGGFGDCIVALIPAGSGDVVGAEVAAAFKAAGYGRPAHFLAIPSNGAQRLA